MKTSEKTEKISKAIMEFHKVVGDIKKSAVNPFFKSKYAPLGEILKAIKPSLEKSGISFVQFPTGNYGLTTRVMFEDEWMEDTFYIDPSKKDPQGAGSSITYQRRYALSAIFGLNDRDDDDANEASNIHKQKTTANSNKKITEAQKKTLYEYVDKKYEGQKDLISEHKKDVDAMTYQKAYEFISKLHK